MTPKRKRALIALVLIVIGILIFLYSLSRPLDFITGAIAILIAALGVWILATEFRQRVYIR